MEKSAQPIHKANMIVVIVDQGKAEQVAEIANVYSAGLKTAFRGRGTADSELLDYLGLGDRDKEIVVFAVREVQVGHVLNELKQRLRLEKHGSGIAFSIRITGVGGRRTLNLLSKEDSQKVPVYLHKTEEEDSLMKQKHQFNLIITIINRGFADDVMDAARAAGAEGGTVVYARGVGIHETEMFFGIAIQPEKEMVLILTQKDKSADIMMAICEQAGLSKEGKGVSFSLPVDDVIGIAHLLDKEGCSFNE